MGKVIRFLKGVRNHWKKSTVAAMLLSYGVNSAKNSYETKLMMREYCEFASKYGDVTLSVTKPFRHITVILNPAADKRKSRTLFDKYCAPLFHLAGLAVTVVQTEFAGQAKELPESLDPKTDAIVIAGGDGTVSETVTGLLRRAEDNPSAMKTLPVGVLPLGRTNTVAQALLGDKERARALADAAMAIIDGAISPVDVIKVESLESEEESKPIYSLAQVEWGSYRDAHTKRDKYWYLGSLRGYASYLFSSASSGSWTAEYSAPCTGCSNCVQARVVQGRRWWHSFMPNRGPAEPDYSKITNANCGETSEKKFKSVEFNVSTSTVREGTPGEFAPHLTVALGPPTLPWSHFVGEGWRRLKGERSNPEERIPVREVRLIPAEKGDDQWLSIDNEDFEVRPLKITILPKTLSLFHPRHDCFKPRAELNV